MSSPEFDCIKAAFKEALDLIGVDIQRGPIVKKCITGTLEKKRCQEMVAMLGQAATKVDMLAEDFDELNLTADSLIGTPNGTVQIDSIEFRVLSLSGDPMDPCVHFLVVLDH